MAAPTQDAQQSVLQKQAIEEARLMYSRLPHGDPILKQSLEGKDTLAEVLRAAEQKCQAHKRKKSSRYLDKLQKYTTWLQNISAVVDVAVQIQAGIGCPLWAPIKFILKVSNDDTKATEQISNLLESVMECLPRLEIYEKLQADSRLQVALLHVFVDVVDFSVRAYRFFRRNVFVRLTKTLVRTFDQDIGAVIVRLERRARAAHETAVALELLAAAEFRRKTEKRQETEEKAQCEAWLKPANVKSVHLLHVKARLQGTCDWIFSVDEYTKWANPHCLTIEHRLLVVSGPPGCGKSVLASSIVVDLEEANQQNLYFAFSSADGSVQTVEMFLRTALWQLLHGDENKDNIEIVHRLRINRHYVLSDLWEAFRSIVSSFSTPIYCVVDALDECRDFGQDTVTEIMSSLRTCTNLRLVLLTRPRIVEAYLEDLEFQEIAISPALLDQDMETFLRAQIFKSDFPLPQELRERVYEDLKNKSDGMFLYVRLMIDDIRKSSSTFEIIKRLQTLPYGLENAYKLVFLRLSQRLDKFELRLAQSVLAFICVSCRPLQFEEFRHAYALQNKISVSDQQPFENFLLIQRPQSILASLDGLVSMTDGILRLTHASVREFLVRPEEQWIRDPDHTVLDFKIDLTDAHRSLSWLCLDYMRMEKIMPFASTSDSFQSLSLVQDSYPFLEYATLNTFHHLNHSGPPCPITIAKIEDVLKSAQSVLWVKNFARLQFKDLSLFEDAAEFLEFSEQMADADLDVRFAAIFEQTLREMRNRRETPDRSDDTFLEQTFLEQIAMYLKFVTGGQETTLDTSPENAAPISQNEPMPAVPGSESSPQLQCDESELSLKDTSALLSRITDILKGHTSLSVAHQIEVYVRLQVSLPKIRAWVDPLKLLFQLILRKASAIPVHALLAVGQFYRRFGKLKEAVEIYTAASRKLHNMEIPLKYRIYEEIGSCCEDLFQEFEAVKAYEVAYKGRSFLFGARHKQTLESLYEVIRTSQVLRSNEERLRHCDILCLGRDLVPELNLGSNVDLQRYRLYCYRNAGDDERVSHMKRCLRATLEQYRESHEGNDDKPAARANVIGLACDAIGDHEAALQYYKLGFENHKRSRGAHDPSTMIAQGNLASIYFKFRMYDQAEALYQDLYEKYLRLLGPNHRLTQRTAAELDECVYESEVTSEDERTNELGLKSEDELEYEETSVVLPIQPMPISNLSSRGLSRTNSCSQFQRPEEWSSELRNAEQETSSEPSLSLL